MEKIKNVPNHQPDYYTFYMLKIAVETPSLDYQPLTIPMHTAQKNGTARRPIPPTMPVRVAIDQPSHKHWSPEDNSGWTRHGHGQGKKSR